MSVFVIRAYVKIREQLATNAAILKRLAEIDKTLLVHDSTLRDLYQKLLHVALSTARAAPAQNRFSPLLNHAISLGGIGLPLHQTCRIRGFPPCRAVLLAIP